MIHLSVSELVAHTRDRAKHSVRNVRLEDSSPDMSQVTCTAAAAGACTQMVCA